MVSNYLTAADALRQLPVRPFNSVRFGSVGRHIFDAFGDGAKQSSQQSCQVARRISADLQQLLK